MNSLLHNSLTDIPLVYFLALFAGMSALGLFVGVVCIWLCDGTRDDDLPRDSLDQLDPYEIAFLRGGPAFVARLAVFDLTEQGYLNLSAERQWFGLLPGSKKLRRCSSTPDVSNLTPIQKAAWSWVATPRLPSQILHRHVGLSKVIAPLCDGLIARLNQCRFLETPTRKTSRTLVAWTLLLGIVGVGSYKLITTAITGQGESLGLILFMTTGVICTAIICRPAHLSDLGHRYLDWVGTELGDWHQAIVSIASPLEERLERLLRMARFGVDHLSLVDASTATHEHRDLARSA